MQPSWHTNKHHYARGEKQAPKPSRSWHVGLAALLVGPAAMLAVACSSSQFSSSSGKKAYIQDAPSTSTSIGTGPTKNPNAPDVLSQEPNPTGSSGDVTGVTSTGGDVASQTDVIQEKVTNLRSSIALTSSQTQNSVWVVTSDGNGAKIVLDAANNYPMTTFKGTGDGSGHRTFVSPWGLFVGTTATTNPTGGKVYFMPTFFKDGDTAQMAVDLNGANILNGSRICVTVFTINNVDYLGAAYTKPGNVRSFYQAPIDATKPGYVDTAKAKITDLGNQLGEWGYSCYTDRLRNYFWSKSNAGGGNISGINLATGAPLSLANAPNGNFVMKGPDKVALNLAAGSQSYALAGAVDGSLLSGAEMYTMANEPVSSSVMISNYAATSLYLLNAKCFSTIADCSAADKANGTNTTAYDIKSAGYMGPLSSLNDGRVLGLERGAAKSNVFLLSLVDPQSIAKGLVITKIKEVPGDAYMYSDFTGSMSLAATSVKTLDLTQSPDFKDGAPFSAASLAWDAEGSSQNKWVGLTLSVLCYKKGATPGIPGIIAAVPSAGTEFDISSAPGCKGAFDQVQITIAPQAPNTLVFSKTSSFKFHGQQ